MAIFAVQYQYADQPEAVTAAKPGHRAYLEELLKRGQLLASGPLTDCAGGLLIPRTAGQAGTEALVAADPIITAGLVEEVTIHHWSPTLGPFTEG
jgi:uncharacterized protein YciI